MFVIVCCEKLRGKKTALMEHLADLNPQQLAAVRHGEGPLLVFAGAGSGKTRVLTRRIANLIIEYEVHPSEIFAVTFTNKAANEMKQRVAALFRASAVPSWVATFHSSCARILRKHAVLLNYTPHFAIYDTSESLSVLKRAYKKLNIDPRLVEPKFVLARIDWAKNNYRFPEDLRDDYLLPMSLRSTVADLYASYQRELQESNAMDFGDLLCNTLALFELEPAILEHYQLCFKHLLIDEYQDTNRVQYLLVKKLAQKHRNICVVGDDDQSIYAFRGATVKNILNFKEDFPDAKVITLHQNYRSTKNILCVANAVIAKNTKRQKKEMTTANPEGELIRVYHAVDERDEAAFVAREIINLSRSGIRNGEIAVFYRTNAQSRAIEEKLCEEGINYEIFGGFKFYDRKEIRDILAYLRLLLNPRDNEAFSRIVNTPPRGLGASSVVALTAFAEQHQLPLLIALRKALTERSGIFSTAGEKKFQLFLKLIDGLNKTRETAERLMQDVDVLPSERLNALSQLLLKIAEESGYLAQLKREDTPEAESRRENIFELAEVAREFVERAHAESQQVSIDDFLERCSLSSDVDEENAKTLIVSGRRKLKDAVSLMTLHLAKGLEFKVVFLVGMEEGLLPHARSLDNEEDLEEERRLCYVGFTRARERLYLSRAEERHSFNRGSYCSGLRSRFLFELPPHAMRETRSEYFGGR